MPGVCSEQAPANAGSLFWKATAGLKAEGIARTGGPESGIAAGSSQNLAGGRGGGGGGSFAATNCLGTSEDILEGEFSVPDRDDDEDKDGDADRGVGSGRDGIMKLMMESGDLVLRVETEVVGEGDLEQGYDGVLELKLLLPKFAAALGISSGLPSLAP